mmetsp:Transcript_8131/g.7682  ORF Transcript_8131/g.7682 Transcript_8131/m.7682 type:complete len:172 (-) Transcript_8131:29-544(-)
MSGKPELTDEQRERIRKSRERAMELRRKRLEQQKVEQERQAVQQRNEMKMRNSVSVAKSNVKKNNYEEEDENVELEDFEIGASQYVTKQDAKGKYCLPDGTLEVCEYTEKDNPRQSKWNKMKLYNRSEIRRRARDRWGGLEGLQEERRRRENKRSEKDMAEGYRLFKKQKK